MRHPILNLGCAALARKEHGAGGNRWCGGPWAALLLALLGPWWPRKMGSMAFALTSATEPAQSNV